MVPVENKRKTPKLLTRRKQAWANQFKPNLLRGTPVNPNAAIESRYYQRLSKLIEQMCVETEKQLGRFFDGESAEEYFAEDASIASQARILTNALIRKFDQIFAEASRPAAEGMAEAANKVSSAAVHSSIQQLSGGLSLPVSAINAPMKEILSATITENVGLIKSIPAKYLEGVQGAVMRSITTGNGKKDLVPYLQKERGVTLQRARMIAADQSTKAMNNLAKARMQKVGITKYEWLHSGGSKEPRPLHVSYNGKIFSFDDPPVIDERTGERGIPGQAINCRCRMAPVIDFSQQE